jgi:hypothetical protein
LACRGDLRRIGQLSCFTRRYGEGQVEGVNRWKKAFLTRVWLLINRFAMVSTYSAQEQRIRQFEVPFEKAFANIL